ncbi:protein FAR1-RELATED SEQUENCE 6-like [Solanum stenotomum]|uniref:protein FAR1-RELATED SEQUENCE 6-like n=1 Tax=Solanum stenotomum TaxID=172797 RepID=UPI0020D16AC7|nr:protein FAR1-RELATED SEQUENCE 6-like [Solanum stenotomum]
MGCTPKDCQNYILQQQRMRTLACDAAAIQKFFASMQMKDDEFFYVIGTDNAARLRNVVWVHTHYKYVYREDIETYKLVFSTWLAAMGNVPPTAILTDQCEIIKAAIARILADTIHRYCIWHIMTKIPAKLKGMLDFKIAKAEFKSIVYNSNIIHEFEGKWAAFIQKYELQDRLWFRNLYSEKEKWVSVFLKYYFWAGMMSTQTSESMHAFFDGYISERSSLKQFVEQYELALRFKYEKELQAKSDSQKMHAAPTCGFDWDMNLQTHYTRSIYDTFVAEHMKRLYHCKIERHPDFNAVEGVEKYSVTDYSIFI